MVKLFLLGCLLALATADTPPDNLHELECQFHALAYQQAVSKVSSSHAAIFDGLRLGNCSNVLDVDAVRADAECTVTHRSSDRTEASAEGTAIFVSVSGNDNNAGTLASPVATLARALALVRSQRTQPAAASITLRAGE